jgi:hypothetical protein
LNVDVKVLVHRIGLELNIFSRHIVLVHDNMVSLLEQFNKSSVDLTKRSKEMNRPSSPTPVIDDRDPPERPLVRATWKMIIMSQIMSTPHLYGQHYGRQQPR